MKTDSSKREVTTTLLMAMVYEKSISRAERVNVVNSLIRDEKEFTVVRAVLSKVSREAWNKAESEFQKAKNASVEVISILDPAYPEPLRRIPDPPSVLYLRRRCFKPNDNATTIDKIDFSKHIAIVGMRDASYEGRVFARELARQLTVRGATIVSGLALGIDAAAHQGALLGCQESRNAEFEINGGIAVLGSGVNEIFPERNASLVDLIIESGGMIISEYGVDTKPRGHFFPERNRIVSGLCVATIIIEARIRSGSLITARLALEQGREVFAVPGSVNSERCSGTNALIKDGAHVLTSVEDVLDVLRSANWVNPISDVGNVTMSSHGGENNNVATLIADERVSSILKGRESVTLDELVELTGIPPQKLSSQLLALEISGQIFRFPGNIFSFNRFVDN